MTNRQKLAIAVASSLAGVLALSGCGSTAAPADAPSDAAHLVCTDDAREEISGALGLETTKPLVPVWKDHRYSCRYAFPGGSMLLSVKDLPDAAATTAWFAGLRGAAPGSTGLSGMGDGAFQEPDGSVVVRKDATVLVVDVSALPAVVGEPPRPRATAARTVATTVLICWKEG